MQTSNQSSEKGGQSACKIIQGQNGMYIFQKILHQKSDYEAEKKVYQIINPILQENPQAPFLQMISYVPDVLSKIISKSQIPEAAALFHFTQVVKAIALFHQKGISHSDIKVGNILIEIKENYIQDLVIDFGHSQFLDSSQKSTKVCGTPQYNPAKLNKEVNMLKEGKIKEISPYCPFQLDLFQLGMLLFTLLYRCELKDGIKSFIVDKINQQSKFWTQIEKILEHNKNTTQLPNSGKQEPPIKVTEKTKDLVWNLLVGKIKKIEDIFQQPVYTDGKGRFSLQHCSKMEEEIKIPEPQMHNFRSETDSRSDGISTKQKIQIAQQYLRDKEQECEDQDKFQNHLNSFLKQQVRLLQPKEINLESILTQISVKDLLTIILRCISQYNEQIFDQPEVLFACKDSLKLQSTLQIKCYELGLKNKSGDESDEDDDEDVENSEFEFKEKIESVPIHIEIVRVQDQNKEERRSVLFSLIPQEKNNSQLQQDKKNAFYKLVSEIEENILNY